MQSIEKTIIKTLAELEHLRMPVRKEWLFRFLLYKLTPKDLFEERLKTLIEENKIRTRGGYYSLSKIPRSKLVHLKNKIQERNKKVAQTVRLLKILPFIKAAFLFEIPLSKRRVKLIIITEKNRVYSAYHFAKLFSRFLQPDYYEGLKKFAFFVSRDNLYLEKILNDSRDPNLLFGLASLRPVLGKMFYVKFAMANPWIKKYFPNLEQGVEFDDEKGLFGFLSFMLEKIICLFKPNDREKRLRKKIKKILRGKRVVVRRELLYYSK